MRKYTWLLILLISAVVQAQDPAINPKWLHGFWHAQWIAHPTASGTQFGVFHFRKSIDLAVKPASFVVNVTADNRYRLFVNGQSVGTGPARSDLANWNYETIDIAPYLKAGLNIIAATVWNFGEYRPYSQISFETAFLLQGNTEAEEILNTNNTWKVTRDEAYEPLAIDRAALQSYVVVAEGEKVNGNHYSWGFTDASVDESKWAPARVLWYQAKSRTYGTDGNWHLVPSEIPMEENKKQYFDKAYDENGTLFLTTESLSGKVGMLIGPNKKMTILLDQKYETNAYPVIITSRGKNASIKLTYAEALFNDKGEKGNRNEVAGKKLKGISDAYILDGGNNRTYSPLFFRTFRFIQLEIETKEDGVEIKDLFSIFAGYPFQEKASFKSNQTNLEAIWETGWRTARLCAVDTYFDCPYYEQLQYVGDTRIQSMISLYVAGDGRLMKKAINDISHSFISDGLTQSRYPSRDLQVIPTFSLWWVCMLNDYYMHRDENAFVASHLQGMESVLQWYENKLAPDKMLGPLSWWQFADWSWDWVDSIRVGGVPPGVSKGGAALITLQFAYTLRRAAQLEKALGKKEKGLYYDNLANQLIAATYKKCWVKEKQLLADSYEKNSFSQHTNIMAILTDAVPAAEQSKLLDKIIKDKSMTQATYYFTFYLFEALKKVKEGDRFLPLLHPWQDMLDRGLTTFAEQADPTRSDCHAWSASPNYELLSLVGGVRSAAPGFKKVLIEPYLGKLTTLDVTVPHPSGNIIIHFNRKENGITGTVELPEGITGRMNWKGKTILLHQGIQNITL